MISATPLNSLEGGRLQSLPHSFYFKRKSLSGRVGKKNKYAEKI